MNLYLNGLFYKGSGIGRYYESLTKELSKRGINIITSVPKRLRDEFEKDFSQLPNIEPIYVDYEKFSLKGFLKHSAVLKKLEDKVDLFFYPHVNIPLYIPEKTIVTIHDLRPCTPYWDRSKIKLKMFKFFLKRAIKNSQHIICISNTVKNELKLFNKMAENKANVIYEFLDDKFTNTNETKGSIFPGPYILYVGNRKKHKNLGRLIKAFNHIKCFINHYLIIAGSKDRTFDQVDTLKKELNLKDRIIEFINPDDATIINLYHNADLFVFPSLLEGFGLPPLESVASGCPVILSDIPIFNEIFEDSALYFNPLCEIDIADKILYVIRNSMIKRNLFSSQKERLKVFDKDLIINQHIEIFSKVLRVIKQ